MVIRITATLAYCTLQFLHTFTKQDVTTNGNSSVLFFTVFILPTKCLNTNIFGCGIDMCCYNLRFVVLIVMTMKNSILCSVMPMKSSIPWGVMPMKSSTPWCVIPMKSSIPWDIMPCSLVEIWCFGGRYCFEAYFACCQVLTGYFVWPIL